MKANISKWYHRKDVAFAIGVDELPIGGSHRYGPDNEEWDTFYWYRNENNFWTKYWKPILDKNPWIKYSLGWIPSHTSPLNIHNYSEPKNVKKEELSWETETGKKWIAEVMKPIFSYGKGHYDTRVFHGYYHEVPMSYYHPYWFPQTSLKGEPYLNPKFFDDTLKNTQRAFQYTWKHNATTLNTFPFGGGRPDAPSYFSRNGIYAAGFWLDMKQVKSIDEKSGLKQPLEGIKSYKRKLGEEIEPEGCWYNEKTIHLAKVGEMGYWHQDEKLLQLLKSPLKPKRNESIIGIPYSVSLEGTTRNFKKRVSEMMKTHQQYDAPILYYFMHAQMDWIDALGGSSPTHIIKGFLDELKISLFHHLTLTTNVKYILSTIAITLLAGAWILKSFPILVTFLALAAIFTLSRIKFYGLNSRKHNKQMQWLNKAYGERIWAADISTAAQYFDIRKKAKIKSKPGLKFEIDTSFCYPWDAREIPITLEISEITQEIKGYYVIKNKKREIHSSGFKQEQDRVIIFDFMIKPSKKRTELGLIV
ncbi:MAG TPA: hypothetical protein VJJ21_03710 [Candidatus Nanoarchaeia archaeon]|nr:hypothetical protein [Candidatus Nanoarchaeia archaeon]